MATIFDTNEANNASKARSAEESRTERQAELVGHRYLDSRNVVNRVALVEDIIDVAYMRQHMVAPLSRVDQQLVFAIMPATSQRTIPELKERFTDNIVQAVMISPSGFEELMLRYDPPAGVEYHDVQLSADDQSGGVAVSDVSSTLASAPPDELFGYLIDQSAKLGASDIHLERTRGGGKIRMRVDGVMHTIAQLDTEKSRQLMSSIARTASFAVASPDPQTGHIVHQLNSGGTANMRVETVMTTHGQDAVMRRLSGDENLTRINDLGFTKPQSDMIHQQLKNPSGMILVAGPTGSGKTTTLYSILRELNAHQTKIVTLEDPVESNLDNIVQIPVNTEADQTFAQLLRSTLRLDPDVILIGEIRDADTARTALQAALTGHLVLSSFHANSATAALARLREMVGHNPLFASAFKLLIAQRLVRTLPDGGRQPAPPGHPGIAALEQKLGRKLTEQESIYIPMPTADLPFGYSGRQVIAEILQPGPKLSALLAQLDTPSEQLLHRVATEEGLQPMAAQGIKLALDGRTTVEELNRVTDW